VNDTELLAELDHLDLKEQWLVTAFLEDDVTPEQEERLCQAVYRLRRKRYLLLGLEDL
jgi:hypothetical protein